VAAALVCIGGCQNMAVAGDVPARIVAPTDASREALRETLYLALGTDVPLAADALTTASVLTIERQVPRSIDMQDAYGRNTEAPLQFRLVKNGADCVLVDPRDGARYVLEDTECTAE
jgi:hypothetical protein